MLYLITLLSGLIVASLTGLILTRIMEQGRSSWSSILIGRSHCNQCKQTLLRRQLIPVVWYMLQKGTCHHCRAKIPLRMTIYEIILAGIFVYIAYIFSRTTETIRIGAISTWLMMMLISDMRYLSIDLWLRAAGSLLIFAYLYSHVLREQSHLVTGILLLYLLVIYGLGRVIAKHKYGIWQEWFGLGDVLMGLPLGRLLSSILWPLMRRDALRHINIYMLLASVWMLIYLIISKKYGQTSGHHLPFLVGMMFALITVGVLMG